LDLIAVENLPGGVYLMGIDVVGVRKDGGHTGSNRALPDDQSPLTPNQGYVADSDAGYVRDCV